MGSPTQEVVGILNHKLKTLFKLNPSQETTLISHLKSIIQSSSHEEICSKLPKPFHYFSLAIHNPKKRFSVEGLGNEDEAELKATLRQTIQDHIHHPHNLQKLLSLSGLFTAELEPCRQELEQAGEPPRPPTPCECG